MPGVGLGFRLSMEERAQRCGQSMFAAIRAQIDLRVEIARRIGEFLMAPPQKAACKYEKRSR